jgi:HPr kinase/phosphorylase
VTGGDTAQVRLHASTVAFPCGTDWAALVILGRSGAGKSELAITLMALGARLVADDQTEFYREGAQLRASAPPALSGLLEMRGMGLLRADPVTALVRAVVDLDQLERDRLPHPRQYKLLDLCFPLFHRIDSMAFAAALRQYMMSLTDIALAHPDD